MVPSTIPIRRVSRRATRAASEATPAHVASTPFDASRSSNDLAISAKKPPAAGIW
jgi:hypothetical protein